MNVRATAMWLQKRRSGRKDAFVILCCVSVLLLWYYSNVLDLIYRRQRIPIWEEEQLKMRKYNNCRPAPLASEAQFIAYVEGKEGLGQCGKWRWAGTKEGQDRMKRVCADDIFAVNPEHCLVLSFGSVRWHFEKDMSDFGCEVYAFDPLLVPGKVVMPFKDPEMPANVHFVEVGLDTYVGERAAPKGEGVGGTVLVSRYEELLHDMRLAYTGVDYLRLDPALNVGGLLGDALAASPYLMLNVKQLGLTLRYGHLLLPEKENAWAGNASSPGLAQLWQELGRLRCLGFKLLDTREAGRGVRELVLAKPNWREDVFDRPDYDDDMHF